MVSVTIITKNNNAITLSINTMANFIFKVPIL